MEPEVGFRNPEQRLEQRRLARAVGPEQAGGSLGKGAGNAGQSLEGSVGDAEIGELHQRCHASLRSLNESSRLGVP